MTGKIVPWIAAVALAGCLVAAHSSRARAADSPPLTPDMQRFLSWLPEDTETLVVAQSFTIPGEDQAGKERVFIGVPFEKLLPLSAIDPLLGKDKTMWRHFAGRKISLAMFGGRHFESVSSFGSLRYEGCSILSFAEASAVGSADWFAQLRDKATEVRKIGLRDVLVFPSGTVMEPWIKPKKWQGTYLVRLDSKTVVCATCDVYLEEVLKRVDSPTATRALPLELPEWNAVDPSAPVWMVRHVPQQERGLITGLSWQVAGNQVHVTYLPAEGKAVVLVSAERKRWGVPKIDGAKTVLEGANATIAPAGPVIVTFAIQDRDPVVNFSYALSLYWSLGDNGDYPAEEPK